MSELLILMTWIWLIVLVVIWDMIWRGIALWKAGKNSQPGWFVSLLIFNTAGILPIIYLVFFQKKIDNQKRLGRKQR